MSSAAENRIALRLLARLLLCLAAFCAAPSMVAAGVVAPDFSLTDANSTSLTYGQPVSPRDYLEQVSGWYFGHAG